MSTVIRIATRASTMALYQARLVSHRLRALSHDVRVDLVPITTAGDQWAGNVKDLGGKGAFCKEIDAALINNQADIAVHCLKDIPGDIPLSDGFTYAAYLQRDDPHDVAINRHNVPLAELAPESLVGTSSVRRSAQLRARYPQLHIIKMRGNVDTRIAKLDSGQFDTLIVAMSGLARLGMAHRVTQVLSLDEMFPSVGAGIIAIVARNTDTELLSLLATLNDANTQYHAEAERAMLYALQATCGWPVAGYATTGPSGRLSLRGKVFSPDGTQILTAEQHGTTDQRHELGEAVAHELLQQGARKLLES